MPKPVDLEKRAKYCLGRDDDDDEKHKKKLSCVTRILGKKPLVVGCQLQLHWFPLTSHHLPITSSSSSRRRTSNKTKTSCLLTKIRQSVKKKQSSWASTPLHFDLVVR